MIGRLASLKTTFQLGTVSNTLLYTATDLITITVSAANQTEDKLTHSVSISGDSGIRNAIIKTGGSDMLMTPTHHPLEVMDQEQSLLIQQQVE